MKIDLTKRQDKGAKRTLKLLRETLWKLLTKTSFDKVTVQMICDESLIPRATFYNYFYDKYDLMDYAIDELAEEIYNTVGDLNYTLKSLETYLRIVYSLIDNHLDTIRKVLQMQDKDDQTYQYFRNRIIKNLESLFLDCPYVDNLKYQPELTARFCSGAIELLISEKIKHPETFAFDFALDFLNNAVNFNGLGMFQYDE